jgi:membrane-bound lytic murein transglycosylase A
MTRGVRLASFLALLAGLSPGAIANVFAQTPTLKIPNAQLEPLSWSALGGWAEDDHVAGFKAFMDSCKAILPRTSPGREIGPMFNALQHVCRRARADAASDNERARGFFEMNFRPVRISTLGEATGFLTGYYEPIVEGSRTWSQEFQVPLYRKPQIRPQENRSLLRPR